MLAGPDKNRVKAIKLRGVISQGIVVPFPITDNNGKVWNYAEIGTDFSTLLGITKYEPVVPAHFSGEMKALPHGFSWNYDIENILKWPNVLQENEEVVITEKIHGTFTVLGISEKLHDPELLNGNMFASSKGLFAQGLVFKANEKNEKNLYFEILKNHVANVQRVSFFLNAETVYVLGETFGPVQDLTYGYKTPQFRVFDIYVGQPGSGRYLNNTEIDHVCENCGLIRVPYIYTGPYGKELIPFYRDGETVVNNISQIREGIVIKPTIERKDAKLGRVQLKAVSPAYLFRKGKKGQEITEFN